MVPLLSPSTNMNSKGNFTTTLAHPSPQNPMPVLYMLAQGRWSCKPGTTCVEQHRATIWVTSAMEVFMLEKKKQPHNPSENKDFHMLPEYRIRGSPFYYLGKFLPFPFPEIRRPSFPCYGRRRRLPSVSHSAYCHADSMAPPTFLLFGKRNSRLSERF